MKTVKYAKFQSLIESRDIWKDKIQNEKDEARRKVFQDLYNFCNQQLVKHFNMSEEELR